MTKKVKKLTKKQLGQAMVNVFENSGWTTGQWKNGKGQFCLLGAAQEALGLEANQCNDGKAMAANRPFFYDLFKEITGSCPEDQIGEDTDQFVSCELMNYNDGLTSVDPLIRKIKKVAGISTRKDSR